VLIKQYKKEQVQRTKRKKSSWIVLPGSKLWKKCEEVAIFVDENNLNPSLFMSSRFFALYDWSLKHFKVKNKSFPINLLLNPKPLENYSKYIKKLKNIWQDSYEEEIAKIENPFQDYKEQILDGLYLRKMYSISEEEIIKNDNYVLFPAAYLATSTVFIDFVSSHKSLDKVSPLILYLWDNMKYNNFFCERIMNIRKEAENAI